MQIGFRPVVKIFLLDSNSIRVFLTNSHHSPHSLIVQCFILSTEVELGAHSISQVNRSLQFFWAECLGAENSAQSQCKGLCVTRTLSGGPMSHLGNIKREISSCFNLIIKDLKTYVFIIHCWDFFSMCLLNLSLTLTSLKRYHMLCSYLLKLNVSLLVPWSTQIQIILLLCCCCCCCYCSENQDIALGSRISFYLEVAYPALIMFPLIFDCLKKKLRSIPRDVC